MSAPPVARTELGSLLGYGHDVASRGAGGFALLANSAVWDAERAARSVRRATWRLPRGTVEPGETFAIWRTLGRDRQRGIVAFGRVLTPAEDGEDLPGEERFWLRPPPSTVARRFMFEFLHAPRLPLWLGNDPSGTLAALTVSRGQGNSKYRIPEPQWATLLDLAGGLQLAHAAQEGPPQAPYTAADGPAPTRSMAQLATALLDHLSAYGSVTERDAIQLAGSPRRYRRLRRHLETTGAPVVGEGTPNGMIWRLAEEP